MHNLDPDNFYHKIYWESCEEFEQVRELCLQEDNWLRYNFTKEQLVIENYCGYGVIYHKETNKPAGMAGLFNPNRYPANVAQHLHREYTFPEFRQRSYSGIVQGFKMYYNHIVLPLNNANSFDTYFVGMQNRYKKSTKGYWNVFSSALVEAMPEWKVGQGYLQTCQADVQKCWQNYAYTGNWDSWDKKILTQTEWDQLIQGD